MIKSNNLLSFHDTPKNRCLKAALALSLVTGQALGEMKQLLWGLQLTESPAIGQVDWEIWGVVVLKK